MDAESFFSRWSRRKAETKQAELQEQEERKQADAQPPAEKPEAPPPTLQDVERLTYSDDLSPFFARQVDELIRRAAMKKLFADPHFNIMDGLDVYIEDYNKFEPLTPEVVAKLNHAAALLNPVVEPQHKLMELLELEPPPDQQAMVTDSEGSAAQEPVPEEPKAETPPSPDTPPHDDQVQGM
jgi:hypothetical protein